MTGPRLVASFLAAAPAPPPGKGAEWGKAAPIGLLILVLLGIALVFLVKSMNRHMRKVTGLTSFDQVDDDAGAAPSSAAASAAAPSADSQPADAAASDPAGEDLDPAGPGTATMEPADRLDRPAGGTAR